MVGATFEGMFYMHGICLDMLTPMLYIFVWPIRWGAIRDKGFAHVPMKPDRVVRSRGRSGMGSNIAWHRRHNDCVD